MGRDLSFWKTSKQPKIKNSQIYYELSNENKLDCISYLPIEEILMDFNNVFFDWNKPESSWYEKEEKSFYLMITNQFVRADCYNLSEKDMNKIIDIMLKYECPLYDSIIDVRFDGMD